MPEVSFCSEDTSSEPPSSRRTREVPKLTDTGLKVTIAVRLRSSPVVHAHARARAIGRSGKVGLRRGEDQRRDRRTTRKTTRGSRCWSVE